MNVRLLQAFIVIVDTGSFSKAAGRLFISQPALSQNVKQLEAQFKTRLIQRDSRNFCLTEAGRILYQHALRVTKAAVEMEDEMQRFQTVCDQHVSVGATSVIGGYAVPCSVFIFKQKYPEVSIKLKLANRRQILEDIRSDLLDVGIIEGEQPDSSVLADEIHLEEMIVIAPGREPWHMQQQLSIGELFTAPLIMREEGSATRWAVEQVFRKAGIELRQLNIVLELTSSDSIKAAVEAGHGISILPRIAVKKELYNKALCQLKIDSLSFAQRSYVVYKNKPQRSVAAKFIKLMKSPANGFC
ncbi:LysR family transcriptional regulator [Anaerospora sp.]|uniref:LysR family transcriptional regulator n=1 Tax=Anaerospora sp. TaxID=1960278 RepID=UPI002897E8E9|nr:LysR family transcriptional regulator [Anaerospora sp.]